MKYLAIIFTACAILVSTPMFAGAQARVTPVPTPVSAVTVRPVLGNLPSADGGLFSRQNTATIGFPNLISAFTSGDFLNDIFGFVVGLLATIGGVMAFIYILYGGVKFVTSGGNPAGAEEGKKMIIGAIIGIMIISLAYVVVLFVRSLLT